MEDFFDGFDGDFIDGEFEDDYGEDDFGEDLDGCEMEDTADEEPVAGVDSNKDEPICDEFDVEDAFVVGGLMGWAYEEGRQERRKRRKNSDSNDPSDID